MTKKWIITRELQAAYERAVEEYSDRPDVTGIEIGFKYENGKRKDELAVRFLVAGKEVEVPPDRLLPEEILKEATDVRSGMLDFREGDAEGLSRKERRNPIQPGISVSGGHQGAGTLGLVVYLKDGAPAILSCAHVLARQGAGKGDPVYQPSPVDGGDPRFDAVGRLEDWFLGEDGDGAVARLNRRRMVLPELLGAVPKTELHEAREVEPGEVLKKSGRGTGITTGVVDGIGRYRLRLFGFDEPVWIEGFRLVPKDGRERNEISRPGDSGAVWYGGTSLDAQGVGLHVDGESGDEEPEFAIACHLPRILERLKVSLSPQAPVERTLAALTADLPVQLDAIRRQLEELKARFPEAGGTAPKRKRAKAASQGAPATASKAAARKAKKQAATVSPVAAKGGTKPAYKSNGAPAN